MVGRAVRQGDANAPRPSGRAGSLPAPSAICSCRPPPRQPSAGGGRSSVEEPLPSKQRMRARCSLAAPHRHVRPAAEDTGPSGTTRSCEGHRPLRWVTASRAATAILAASPLSPNDRKDADTAHVNVGRSFKLSQRQLFTKILLPSALPTIFVGLRLGLIFALINILGVEFLINVEGRASVACRLTRCSFARWRLRAPRAATLGCWPLALLGTLQGRATPQAPSWLGQSSSYPICPRSEQRGAMP
jgi:hypothetical protein